MWQYPPKVRKNMKLLGRERLDTLQGLGDQVQKWIQSWANEVTSANWKHETEVTDQFPNARTSSHGVFLFPVSGCGWQICLLIAFPQGVALITELKIKDEIYGS